MTIPLYYVDQRGWQARSDQGQLWVTAGEYSQICTCSL